MDGATRPQPAECDPKHSIKARQNWTLTFSLKCRELQPESGIFERDGFVTAHQEADQSKDRQEKGRHVSRLFVSSPFKSTGDERME